MSIKTAFNTLLKLHSRDVTISRPGTVLTKDIIVSPSNFYRNMEGPADTSIKGREFVIGKDQFDGTFTSPKRGDKLQDSELGYMTLREVREMFDIGGAIIGYRIRTD